jgi:hypothetical protein
MRMQSALIAQDLLGRRKVEVNVPPHTHPFLAAAEALTFAEEVLVVNGVAEICRAEVFRQTAPKVFDWQQQTPPLRQVVIDQFQWRVQVLEQTCGLPPR